jgi:hypothetical protein
MRDPWESDISTEEVSSELEPVMINPRADLRYRDSQQPATGKPQQRSTDGTDLGIMLQKQSKPNSQSRPKLPPEVMGLLQINPENIIQGIIWAEILGKPKSRRSRL